MMISLRALVLIVGLAVIGCSGGSSESPSASRDDAGYANAVSLAPDANSVGADAGLSDTSMTSDATCGDPAVTHVQANDAAGLSSGCISAASSVCTSVPRVTFACPVVRGPADSGAIAPGDTITVSVLMGVDCPRITALTRPRRWRRSVATVVARRGGGVRFEAGLAA